MPLRNSAVDTNSLIDTRNQVLWEDVIARYEAEIKPSGNAEYGVYSQSSKITFYVPENDLCTASFTHELLHVYIRLKDIYFATSLQSTLAASNILSRVFVPSLTEHVGNCLDHVKMLPIYLQMGFAKEKFLLDYHEHKCTDVEIRQVKNNYKLANRYNNSAVEHYIAKYFAMKTDPNDTFDYTKQLSILCDLDSKLFATLELLLHDWLTFDLENKDPMNSYHRIVTRFYENMKTWMTGKSFF